MSHELYDIVIIGGGFSGILAANILAEHKLNILLIDENIHLGGQYLRSHRNQAQRSLSGNRLKSLGLRSIKSLNTKHIHIMFQTEVLGITNDKEILLCESGERLFTVKPKVILLATGAREKFVPFKGWTLPGIISTGATQILLKGSGVLPSDEILIAGAGIFPYAVASEILMSNGRVKAILDQNFLTSKIAFSKGIIIEKSKITEGIQYLSRLLMSRTRIMFGMKILKARGNKHLEEVLAVRTDRNGHMLAGSEISYPCDCLSIGYGFIANIETAQLAGCEIEFDDKKGGWIVWVNDHLETTIPGIFAAGEITGIAGATKAITEGKLAAYSICRKLRKISEQEYQTNTRPLNKDRSRHLTFGGYFNSLNRISKGHFLEIANETIICRCEDITMGEIKTAIKEGCITPDSVKKAVRTGMGICQGRTCGTMISEIIAGIVGKPTDQITPLSVRTPLKAVPLGALASPISELKYSVLEESDLT